MAAVAPKEGADPCAYAPKTVTFVDTHAHSVLYKKKNISKNISKK